ncbi:MAG TPA: MBL fold metallo-hydrolase [Rudaea sp.]|jgi:glyoxylase-like metal-dependent hydrolase (beta-lactamase superfamily II)|uniref:MBL fold metallo-hydrolase n=1 Tax=Rudaea sp. TaxID=2136325 RepID=UPI002F92813B
MKKMVLACALALCASTAMSAEIVPIAAGIDLIPGEFVPNRQPDGNSLIFRTPTGLVVMDTGRHAEHAQRILAYAQQAKLPIKAVINSHWHLDHIGGNPRIRADYPGVQVFASAAINDAMHGFLANYRKQLEEAIAQAKDASKTQPWRDEIAIIDAGHALYPDVIIDKTQTRRIADRDFVLHLESHAVTAGDVWVFEPKTRALAAGDLVTLPVPFLDTACPAHWKIALDDLAHADFKTLVPGHGAPMSRAQFEAYRKAYDNLYTCAASSKEKGICIDGWIADAKPLLGNTDPRFVKSLVDYYLDNSLRAPKAKLDKLCGAAPSPAS